MKSRLLIATLVAAWCTFAAAQAPVYESKDKAGPVFSDQPSPGARQLDLPPPNVIQVPMPAPQQSMPAAPTPSYSSLVIVSPENQGTIHSNTGAIDISVQMSPVLRAGAGDRIKVLLDGNLLITRYNSATLRLTETDWQAAARSDNVEHTLQVAIVDRTGAVLIQSAPVSFYVHRATVRRAVR